MGDFELTGNEPFGHVDVLREDPPFLLFKDWGNGLLTFSKVASVTLRWRDLFYSICMFEGNHIPLYIYITFNCIIYAFMMLNKIVISNSYKDEHGLKSKSARLLTNILFGQRKQC